MDKFGIFKLLGSFLDAYKNQNQKPQENIDENQNPLLKILSSKPNSAPPQKTAYTAMPLQQNMLFTMHSHDEFVKRVNKNLKQ